MAGNFPQRRAGRLARHSNEDTSPHYGEALQLPWNNPAVIEGRTIFTSTVVDPEPGTVLTSGVNNPKIGKRVEKGAWLGWPIYLLTLEERDTCSRSCHHWHTCYGNAMHLARRHRAGPALEDILDADLAVLQSRHPEGFVVRLHVLGDFYSEDYVARWRGWLQRFPALHCYGYTAHPPDTTIGRAVWTLATERWDRFAIRLSVPLPVNGRREAVTWWGAWPPPDDLSEQLGGAVLCPAQRHATETCGTCALCWSTQKSIAFAVHGRRAGGPGRPRAHRPEEPPAANAEPQQDPAPLHEEAPEVQQPAPALQETAGETSNCERKALERRREATAGDAVEEAIATYLRRVGESRMGALGGATRFHDYTLRPALKAMAERGLIEITGVRAGTIYRWVGDRKAPEVLPRSTQTPSEEGRGERDVDEGEAAGKAPLAPRATPAVGTAPPPQARPSPPARATATLPTSSSPAIDERLRDLWDKGESLGAISVALAMPVPWVKRRAGELKLPGADAPPEVIDA